MTIQNNQNKIMFYYVKDTQKETSEIIRPIQDAPYVKYKEVVVKLKNSSPKICQAIVYNNLKFEIFKNWLKIYNILQNLFVFGYSRPSLEQSS